MLFALIPAQAQAPYHNLSQARNWIEPIRTPVIATESPIIVFNIRNGYTIPNRNILSPAEVKIDERTEIINHISELWKDDAKNALRIFYLESGLNPYAYNPETEAKRLGKTQWSSCGIAQINSPQCIVTDNPLFDYKYNLDIAFKKYQENGWYPWYRVSKSLKVL